MNNTSEHVGKASVEDHYRYVNMCENGVLIITRMVDMWGRQVLSITSSGHVRKVSVEDHFR